MHRYLLVLSILFLLISCANVLNKRVVVKNATELQSAIESAQPGDQIVMANGVWKDIRINFAGNGTEQQPITLRAETPGMVTIEGKSCLKLGGQYLVVDGLYFRNGSTPSDVVIDFKIDRDHIANHCKVINTVIEEFNQPNRQTADLWVEFSGRHNQLDHCYIAGKFNQGPTLRVDLKGNEHIRNYHQITNNYFGPRPRKGGARAETIQIGSSFTSMAPSYVNIANNFFERCNGEVEVISSKSNFNEFRSNVFYECEGSLVMRHGNYCIVDGNFFIGDKNSQFNGGIRVINTGHWVTNNYFYRINGDEFRGALAIMNGIPKSPLNRYNQVTDAVVAYNTWIDCKSPWQISVGANKDKKDVLPASEIRSARPLRTVVANNIVYDSQAQGSPIKAYDKIDGIDFQRNLTNMQSDDAVQVKGLTVGALKMKQLSEWLYVPAGMDEDLHATYDGFGFEDIEKDIFGNSRSTGDAIGAISGGTQASSAIFDRSNYGPAWFTPKKAASASAVIAVATDGDLAQKLADANDGDVLELSSGSYKFSTPLKIDKKITIRSKDQGNKAKLVYAGAANTPAFQMKPKGNLVLHGVELSGTGEQFAFAPLETQMYFGYNLSVNDSRIQSFRNIMFAYKGSFADTVSFSNTILEKAANGIELAAETDDKGDYNAEFLTIKDCHFRNIASNVINFYRGGYDESTIGGNLHVAGSTFENCGSAEKSKILLKTRGIINVNITGNTFKNNPVKLVALLWGEKNNHHDGNKMTNSGSIRVDRYLKQKLLY